MRRISLQIVDPCHEPWEAMTPVAGGRHCAACDKRVVDLTLATEAKMQAMAALYGNAGLCTRFMVRPGQNEFTATVPDAVAGLRMSSPLVRRAAMVASLAMPAAAAADKAAPVKVVACEAPATPLGGLASSSASSSGAAGARPMAPRAAPSAAPSAPPPERPIPLGGAPRMVDPDTGDITQAGVFFARDSADLANSSAVLDEIARELKTGPKFAKVNVLGSAEFGEKRGPALSRKRAQAVRKALIKRGVSAKMIVASGISAKAFADVRASLHPSQPTSEGGYMVGDTYYSFKRAVHFAIAR